MVVKFIGRLSVMEDYHGERSQFVKKYYNVCNFALFCALHDQLAKYVDMCCFSAVAKPLVCTCMSVHCGYRMHHAANVSE